MPWLFPNLIVKKTKKFNHLRRFWGGLKAKVAGLKKSGKKWQAYSVSTAKRK